MKNIFTPAIYVMNRLKYYQKFLLIGGVVIAIIALLTFSLYQQLDKKVIDSRLQLDGINKVIQINHLIQLAQQYRGLSMMDTSQHIKFAELKTEKQQKINEVFYPLINELDPQMSLITGAADISADRNLMDLNNLAQLSTLWGKLKEGQVNSNAKMFSQQTYFIRQLKLLMTLVNAHYLLKTDADLASSYMLDIVTHDTPRATEVIGKIRGLSLRILSNKKMSVHQKEVLIALEDDLKESVIEFQYTLRNISLYSPHLKGAIQFDYLQLITIESHVSNLLNNHIYNRHFNIGADEVWFLTSQSIDSIYRVMDQFIYPNLKQHISLRIERLLSVLMSIVVSAFLLLIITIYLIIAMYIAMLQDIKNINKVVNAYAKGDFNSKIRIHTQDEIHNIGISINKMGEQLDLVNQQLIFQKLALDEHAIVSITDIKGNILYINKKFEQISKYTKKELLAKNHRLLKSNFHSKAFFREMWHTISHGKTWNGEIKNIAKDGSIYWVEATIVPYLDKQGKPEKYIAIRTDITKIKEMEVRQKRANELLLTSKENADRANQAKSNFLSSMSHELRTPLNAVLGFAQLLEMDDSPELSDDQKESVQYILSSGEHLLALINDVLELSAIETGLLELSIEALPLLDKINEALALLIPLADKAHIKINLLSDTEVLVNADATKLKQVIINLVSNAIKYNVPNGRIDIEWELIENDFVQIKVLDTGIGISEQNRHKVFNAFNRLGQERSNIEGTGIGLVLTRDIVKMMGGQLDFSSIEGEGSQFWFTIPSKAKLTEHIITINEEDTSSQFKNKQVLYVEDNMANRRLMQSVFDKYPKYDLQIAASAELGWQLTQEYEFDLILMDINLPNMSGKELTEKLRMTDMYRYRPIIAVSVASMRHEIEAVRNLFDTYVTKPIHISKLRETLKKYLN